MSESILLSFIYLIRSNEFMLLPFNYLIKSLPPKNGINLIFKPLPFRNPFLKILQFYIYLHSSNS